MEAGWSEGARVAILRRLLSGEGVPMRVCLFEDSTQTLDPLTLTRPVFDLRCGLRTLGEKQRHAFGATAWGLWMRPLLGELARLDDPGRPINDAAWVAEAPT